MTRTATQRSGDVHVLIAGGGVAGVEAALALRALGDGLFDVEIVAPEHHFFYRPLAVAVPFDVGRVYRWELSDLARAAGAHFTPGALDALDTEAHVAYLGNGRRVEYDVAILTCGARSEPAIPGAFTFRGPADTESFRSLIDECKTGGARRLVFAVPSGIVWPLPLYELALMTAHELEEEAVPAEVTLVTSEPAPLALFGEHASEAVAAALAERRITVHARTYAAEVAGNALTCVPSGEIEADRVVALPRLKGPLLDGIPKDRDGFVPTDAHGRVRGTSDLYAAGDITTFPIKQGGLAAQQADAVAEAIAADAGVLPEAAPFRPVLRALLLTGSRPIFLRIELRGGRGETSSASDEPLWWPPGKIVGRHLAPFLAGRGLLEFPRKLSEEDVVRIEVDAADWHESLWRE
jgi:sulfide:quinone oxidoreductase